MVALRGLSPRVRGNHGPRPGAARQPGSIPAGAGKPRQPATAASCSRVNPRGCGETDEYGTMIEQVLGLSPRVRGNLSSVLQPLLEVRSIPAGAGNLTPSSAHVVDEGSIPAGAGKPR